MVTKNIWRGDAPDIAQVSRITAPPSSKTIRIQINGKTLGTYSGWDAAAIVEDWNDSTLPEFQEIEASVSGSNILLTAKVPGIPFVVSLSYSDEELLDEVVLINKYGFSGTVSGTVDVTFNGETDTLSYDFDASGLQAALEAFTGVDPGDVTCVDVSSTQIKVTFGGQYADIDAPSLTIDDTDLFGGTAAVSITEQRAYSAGVNEIQRIVIGGAPTGGTITYDLNGTSIGPLDYDDDETAYQAAFDSALGSSNSDVTFQSGSGESGPEQKFFPKIAATTDDGIVHGSTFDNSGDLILGKVSDELTTIFLRCSLGSAAVPGNAVVERANLWLPLKSNDANASSIVTIKAVDADEPGTITSTGDYAGRTLTTASVSATILPTTLSPGKTLVDISSVIQELLDSYGDQASFVISIASQSGSVGQIKYHDYTSAIAAGIEPPTLSVVYRDSSSGPTVIDVEFIGANQKTNMPLMTVSDNSLTPGAKNTKFQIEVVYDTGAPVTAKGYAQLYENGTLIDSHGSGSSPVDFDDAAKEILDEYFGASNYTLTETQDVTGQWVIELKGIYSGATNLPDDLVLKWTPIAEEPDPLEAPTVTYGTLVEGGTGVGEIQELTPFIPYATGDYALRVGDETTTVLSFGGDITGIKDALEALPSIGSGKVVSVTGGWASSVVIEFHASLGDVPLIEVIYAGGGGYRVSIVQQSAYQLESSQYQTMYYIYGTKYFTSVNIECSSGATALITSPGGWDPGITSQIESMLASFHPEALSITVEPFSGNNTGGGWGVSAEVISYSSLANVSENPENAQFSIGRIESTHDYLGVPLWHSRTVLQETGDSTGQTWDLNIFVNDVLITTLNLSALSYLEGYDFAATIQNAISAHTTGAQVTVDVYGSELGAAASILVSAPELVTFTVTPPIDAGGTEVTVETTRESSGSPNEVQRLTIGNYANIGGGSIKFVEPSTGDVDFWSGPPMNEQEFESMLTRLLGSGNFTLRSWGAILSPDSQTYDITFIGAFAGLNVDQLVVTNLLETLDPDWEEYNTASWAVSQIGSSGAGATITEKQEGSVAVGAKYAVAITGSPHKGTFTLTANSETTSALDYNDSASDVQAAVVALASMSSGDVTAVGSLSSGMVLSFLTSVGAVTLTGTNVDLTNARITTTESTKGGKVYATEVTRSQGKNHWDDPLNWTLGHVPIYQEQVVIETGIEGPKYGLIQAAQFTAELITNRLICQHDFRVGQKVRVISDDTLPTGLSASTDYYVTAMDHAAGWIQLSTTSGGSAVSFTAAGTGPHYIGPFYDSIVQHNRFSGPIGLPIRNDNNYYEYRNRYLDFILDQSGTTRVEIGRGEEQGPGLMRLNCITEGIDLNVFSTSSSSEAGSPTLNILCNDASAVLRFYGGDSGIGFYEGETSTLKDIIIRGGEVRGGEVTIAANGSITHDGNFPGIRKLFESTGVTISQEA